MPDQAQRARSFRALHAGDPFIIPNPWDAGAARVLAGLGFRALATTSSGFAFTLGRNDSEARLAQLLEHVALLVDVTELPLSVDLEHGHGPRPEDAAAAVTRVAEAGAVGGSIEDWDPVNGQLYPLDIAVQRITAAIEAARQLPFEFTLTARAENHLRGHPDLPDTIARLRAFDRAGADVLFAPGLSTVAEIRAVCEATEKPVNVLAHAGLSMKDITAAGARRVSVGGGLTWIAARAAIGAAERMRDLGDFSDLTAGSDVTRFLDAGA